MLQHKHLLPMFLLVVLIGTACSKKTQPTSLATLKPVARILVKDKSSFPDVHRYTMSLYSDQRLEFTGYTEAEKLGNYTTMFGAEEMAMFVAMTKKFGKGHFSYLDEKNKLHYDVLYYPLKKEISMSDAVVLPLTADMSAFVSKVQDIVEYKKWIKKEQAPKIMTETDAGNLLVTLRMDGKITDLVKYEKFADLKFKAIQQTDKNTNSWLMAFAPSFKTSDAVYRIKQHPDVLGAIPNSLINVSENLKAYETQELIVQFKEKVLLAEWVKPYANYDMKALEQVAPDMNYWTVSFNSTKINAKDLITRIKQDTKVTEAQMNRKVSIRE
jgi:hypothetical protein